MPLETDPFSKVFNALWALADASGPLNDLILPGNKIKFNLPDNRDPQKSSVLDADLAELMLSTNGIPETNLSHSSCDVSIKRQYSWLITTGDFRTNYRLFPVEWAIICAMSNYEATLAALTYEGVGYVKLCRINTGVEGISNALANRNIRGWSAIWACTVEMYFKRSILKDFNTVLAVGAK